MSAAAPLSLPRAVLAYALCIPPLIVLPVAIWAMNWPFIANSAGNEYEAVEIFGFCVTLVVIAITAWRLSRLKRATIDEVAPVCAFALLSCYFAAHTTEFAPPSTDWHTYVQGATALLHGENPYAVRGFLYPPFAAQALAALYRAVALGASHVPASSDPDFIWKGVFYVYQAMQFFLVLGACGLSYLFSRQCGVPKGTSAALVAALFVFNTPLLRTLHNQQVNLYLLDAILIAALGMTRWPFLSGMVIGLASHIKLYPLLLLVPAAVLKRWRVIFWGLLAIVGIFAVQTGWGREFDLYRRYLDFAKQFGSGTAYRDNSIHSVVFNTARAVTGFKDSSGLLAGAVSVTTVAISAAIVIYFGLRFAARERIVAAEGRNQGRVESLREAFIVDTIAALLLLSPIVWEHHYVLMIPVAIWAIATVGKARPWAVGIGTFLMFCLPIFDVYPLSYHRLAGLIVLVWCTRPAAHLADAPRRLRSCPQRGPW